jgi:hypothetical protein
LPDYEAIVAQIHQRWQQGLDDAAIASELTAQGYHSARSDRFSAAAVGRLRLQHGWQRVNARDQATLEGHLSILELANLLNVSRSWLYNRIRTGRIPTELVTRHPEHDRLFVRRDPELLSDLRKMKKNARSQ